MEDKWIAPLEAARRVSERAGYIVTPDDLKQMKRRGKIKRTQPITSQVTLYDAEEIAVIEPPKKRVQLHQSWEEFIQSEKDKRRKKSKADQEAAWLTMQRIAASTS